MGGDVLFKYSYSIMIELVEKDKERKKYEKHACVMPDAIDRSIVQKQLHVDGRRIKEASNLTVSGPIRRSIKHDF